MSSELQPTALPIESAVHHHHDPAHIKVLVDRLARIEGHVRGISNMVREDRPCPEVLVQISAVRAALTQVARLILKEHLSDCIVHAVNNGGGLAEIQALNQAIDRFLD
ncbi:metal-sensing transcriptional repressor [Gloeobacter kilaueensis]|uniref:Transcriptional repressor RcnR to maintain nickel and cobalt homeostasis n=1 Tax=Gloeobacter kilaueensis (strain ATCC BAA-2537 / CCAP 1431/1 / ULC 316 / JS1) TaxID=1183438 RepID=U5QN11_GLOK1|nr:metal-sensing transcriptional repressor [Gloeobacter kilaueensis]AGY59065.1 transcriptional repressor RcnR to maintain nickel and cobalt homeostasis [Gloeobacter kilaueensis JS1]